MGVTTTQTNKPFNPRGNDQSPKGYNRAKLYSGKALDFDGVGDSIDISNFSLNGYTAFSICFHKTDDFNNGMIFSSADSISDGVNIYQVSPGYFRARLNGVNAVDTTLKVSDKDGFFVFTYDGTNAKWYYQAQNTDSGTTSQTFSIANTTSTIGRQSFASVQYLNGQIAGFKLFNTALTAAQVADLYNNPEKVVPTGVDNTALKLWLPMMEGAGTTAYDGSGNGNHGTIAGATYVNGIGAPVAQSAVISWNKGSNLVTYSEDLTQWGTNDFPVVAQSSTIAPDGSTNAIDVTVDGTQAYARIKSNTISMAGDYVGSFYLKKTTGAVTNYPGFDIGGPGHYVLVDTTNGTAQSTGGSYTDILVTSYNETWWRVSAKINTTTTDNAIRLWPALSNNPGSIQSYVAGTATFWGAQVEQADAIGSYVYTGATAQTSDVLLPQGLTTGRDITGVNLFENVRKQGALNLDGNSWAEVHDNESLDFGTGGISMELWSNIDDLANYNLMGKWAYSSSKREYNIFYSATNNRLECAIGNGANATFLTANYTANGDWFHIVLTADNTNIKVFINGSQSATTAQAHSLGASSIPLMIGTEDSLPPSKTLGQIAQPRIYNRALTAEEVQRNYNAGKNTYTN